MLLLGGATFMAFMVLCPFGFSPEAMFKAVDIHPKHLAIMAPGGLVSDPISAISLGLALMFGTAGLPHILMRFFTGADAKAARKSVFYATGFIGYFYILTFIIGFGAITLLMDDPALLQGRGDGDLQQDAPICSAAPTWPPSISPTRSAARSSWASSRR